MDATLPLSQPGVNAKKTTTMILIVWPACMLFIGILTIDLEENIL